MTQLDLRDISKTGNLGIDLAGTFSGKLALAGKTDAPSIAFQGSAPQLSIAGYSMNNLTTELSGNMADIKLNNLSAQIGSGKLSASGNIKPSDGTGKIDFTGTGLDLAKLTESVPELKGQIAGTLSANFSASLSAKGAFGQGNANAPSLKIYGMQLSDVSLPLTLDGASFKFGQGTAKLNGGALSLNGDVNTQTLKYTGKLNASDVDVNALIHDLVPDIKGSITGKGALDVTFNGTVDPKFTLGGTGQAKIGSGGISGFKWVDLVSKLHGIDSVRYTEVTAPFKLETTRIIFQKGSKASAPSNDPLYKYVQIEGPITYAGDLNLTGDGNMNFQLINILTGGALGAAGAIVGGNVNEVFTGKGLESLLTQAVSGGSSAGKQTDFRDVSFKIGGNVDNPSFSVVKVGSSSSASVSSPDSQKQPQNIQETVKDAVKDRVLDSLGIPTQPKDTSSGADTTPKQQQAAPSETKGTQQQQAAPDEKESPKKPENVIREEAEKALKDIFKRR
jgi:translocation and assembly module TamB